MRVRARVPITCVVHRLLFKYEIVWSWLLLVNLAMRTLFFKPIFGWLARNYSRCWNWISLTQIFASFLLFSKKKWYFVSIRRFLIRIFNAKWNNLLNALQKDFDFVRIIASIAYRKTRIKDLSDELLLIHTVIDWPMATFARWYIFQWKFYFTIFGDNLINAMDNKRYNHRMTRPYQ